MKSVSSTVFIAALLFSGAYGIPQGQPSSSTVTLNTPTNLVTCEPVLLTWTGGTAPFFLSLQDGNNFNGAALNRFPQQSTNTLSWTVDVPGGKKVAFLLRDSNGQTSLTAPVEVQRGNQDSCVDMNLSFAPSSGSPSAPAGGASGGGASPTTPAAAGGSGTTQGASPGQNQTPSGSSSDSAAVAQSTSNAASKLTVAGFLLPAVASLLGVLAA